MPNFSSTQVVLEAYKIGAGEILKSPIGTRVFSYDVISSQIYKSLHSHERAPFWFPFSTVQFLENTRKYTLLGIFEDGLYASP